jgi:ADP-ribosylglycohydrolase
MSLTDALLCLRGLSIGDAFGETFFAPDAAKLIAERRAHTGVWHWTDDTHMALSIVAVLREVGRIDQDKLATQFAHRYIRDQRLGYAAGARALLFDLASGKNWRSASKKLFDGGSYGNGAAMRVAPVGAFFAGEPERAAEEARLSAEVTHAHPEGQAGAMAVAAAAAIAARDDVPRGIRFLMEVMKYIPDSEVKSNIDQSVHLNPQDVSGAVEILGSGQKVSAQDTVPFALWCAAYNLDDFEDALWNTVAGLGDRDTTCAIVGGIVALSAPVIPNAWLHAREPLPQGFELKGIVKGSGFLAVPLPRE